MEDIFIIKLSVNNEVEWGIILGSSDTDDIARDIEIDKENNIIYVGGRLANEAILISFNYDGIELFRRTEFLICDLVYN